MDRYAVIDEKNNVINTIVWNGKSQWSPPKGCIAMKNDNCGIGDIWHEESKEFIRQKSKEMSADVDALVSI